MSRAKGTVVRWDEEKDSYFREIVPGHTEPEIRALFLDRFGIELTEGQIGNRKTKLRIRSGTHGGRFVKGQQAWNKGKTWEQSGITGDTAERIKATQFKKGNAPHNTRPIGSEWVDDGGYVFRKVRDGNGLKRFDGLNGRWVHVALLNYVEAHGSIPDNCIILHADRDKLNNDPSNLVAVDRGDYAYIQSRRMPYYDRLSLEVCIATAKLARAKYRKGKEAANG